MPVEPLKDLPCTYDHMPIRALQGVVHIQACFGERSTSTTVFIAGPLCQPLISHNLIDGLGLAIKGRYDSKLGVGGSVSATEQTNHNPTAVISENADSVTKPESSVPFLPVLEVCSNTVESMDLKDFPMLMQNRLGSYPHFQHKIQLRHDAMPVEKRMQPIRYAL